MKTTNTQPDPEKLEALARTYLRAVGEKDLTTLRGLVTDDVAFAGPAMTLSGADALLTAFRRIAAIHVRNDVRRVFVDGDEICVIYDFVTETAGALPTIEWLRVEDGRIQSIKLYYDQLPWLALRKELAARAAVATA